MLALANKLTNSTQPIYRFVNKYSIDFDGLDQYINVDTLAGTMSTGQAFTISVWFKGTGDNHPSDIANILFSAHGTGNSNIVRIGVGGSGGIFYGDNLGDTLVNSGVDYDDIKWHHLVLTKSTGSSLATVYVDGASIGTITEANPLWTDAIQYSIGQEYDPVGVISDCFKGNIDELALFDRELTQAEITRMYNTYYSPNRVANGNFSQIGNEEVTNGDFSQIGSELVTNGNFATDSDWTRIGNATIQNGYAELTFDGTTGNQIRQTTLTSGKIYKVQYEILSNTGTDGQVFMNAFSNGTAIDISVGTYTLYLTAINTTFFNFRTLGGTGGSVQIDNVSVKEVGQDWLVKYSGTGDWSITDKLNFENVNGATRQNSVFVIGKTYKITVDYVFTSGTRLILPYDGSNFDSSTMAITTPSSANGYTYYYTPISNTSLNIYSDGNGNGSVDNISVKEVGQHFTFGTGWGMGDGVATCDGTNGARFNQFVGFEASKNYKFSIKVSNYTSGSIGFQYYNGSYVTFGSMADGVSTTEFTTTGTPNGYLYIRSTNFIGSVDNIVLQELKHDATNLMLNHSEYQSANPLITSTKSMEFDGSDNYLEVQDSSDLQLAGQEASFTFWVRLDGLSGGDQKFLAKALTTGVDLSGYQIRTSNNDLIFQFYSGSWRTLSSSLFFTDTTNWVNATITIDSSNLVKMYKNGVEVFSGGIGYSIPANSGELLFGARTPATPVNFLNGEMTEVGIYNRALTSLEVASLYNQGMPTNLLVNRNNYQSGNPTVFNTKQVDFDGADDHLKVTNAYGSFTGTFSFWINRDNNTGYQYLFDSRESSGAGRVYMDTGNDNIVVSSGTSYVDGVAATVVPTDGNWHNVIITGITLDIVNSIIFGSDYGGGNSFNGNISQVGLWNSTLTADEVSSLYNHGLPIDLTTNQAAYESSSNLVGYWRMGSGTLDTYPLIADQTNATLSAELITDGDFPTGTTAWNTTNGFTIANGVASYDAITGFGTLDQTETITQGKIYKLEFTISNGTARINFTNQSSSNIFKPLGSTISNYASNTYSYYVEALTSGTSFRVLAYNNGGFTSSFSIDNISLKQVNGNPAIMINLGGGADFSDGIKNGSPYANIVQNGTFDTDSDWNLGSGQWVISNGFAVGTNASNNLHTNQPVAPSNGIEYTVTFTLKDVTSGYIRVGINIADSTQFNSDGTYSLNVTSSGNNYLYITPSNFNGKITNITATEVNTGLQGYWKMGDGTNDEYPVIYDQTDSTLGSEIVTNGDFATDSDWTKGTGWSIANGKASSDGVSSSSYLYQENILTLNTFYKVTVDVITNSGEVRFYITSSITKTINSTGTFTFYAISDRTDLDLYIQSINFNGSVDNISVKEVQGNPATMTNMVEGNITNQFPLTKIRNYYRMGDGILDGYPIIQDQTSPNLAHIPTTNVLLYSNDFSNAQWQKLSGSSIGNRVISPDGTLNGWEINFDGTSSGRIEQPRTGMSSGENYSVSVFARVSSGTQIVEFGSVNSATYTLNTQWQRLTRMEAENDTVSYSRIVCNDSATIEIFGFQLEKQSQATAYIKSDGIAAVRKATTTNLLEYSEDFSQSFWTPTRCTITSNQITSPNGTLDADLLTATDTSENYLQTPLLTVSGTLQTSSFYIKKGTSDFAHILLWDSVDDGSRQWFDLTNGTVGTSTSFGSGITVNNAKIISYSNDWYRCTVVFSNSNANIRTRVSASNSNGGTTSTVGKTIYIWGSQLEVQTQAETYAKTTGLPVTIDLFTENNYGTMTNMSASDIIEDTPNN